MIPAQVQYKLGKARQFLLASNFAQALPRYQKLSRLCAGNAGIWFEYGNAAAGWAQFSIPNGVALDSADNL